MLHYFEVFTSCQGSMRTFSKHYSKCKTASIKSEKHCQRGDCQYEHFHRITHKTIFLNFLTSKNFFITLQYYGDVLEIFLKQTFVECFSNILETLLCDYCILPKDKHLLLSNHTLLAQKQLSLENFLKNIFL